MPNCLRLVLVGFLLLTSLSAAPMPWTQLKVGMAGEEIISLLGDPLFRSAGRGFETWTYDDGAEVLIYGLVVGWTTPASATIPVRSHDVWRDRPRDDYYATLRSAVRKTAPKAQLIPAVRWSPLANPPPARTMGYEAYSRSWVSQNSG